MAFRLGVLDQIEALKVFMLSRLSHRSNRSSDGYDVPTVELPEDSKPPHAIRRSFGMRPPMLNVRNSFHFSSSSSPRRSAARNSNGGALGSRNLENILSRFGPGTGRSSSRMSGRARSSSRLSRKGLHSLLSKKGALLKARRDSADAATIAADQLAAAEQRLKAAKEAHQELVHNHDTTLRSKADTLGKGAAAHLDHPALESIRDLRLFSTTPAKTALISRCACVLVRVHRCRTRTHMPLVHTRASSPGIQPVHPARASSPRPCLLCLLSHVAPLM